MGFLLKDNRNTLGRNTLGRNTLGWMTIVLALCLALVVGLAFDGLSYAAAGSLESMHPDRAYKAGKALFDKGNWAGAMPYFFVAVKGNPSAANLRITADTLVQLRRFDEAVVYYERAAEKYQKSDPQAAIALSNKAKQYKSELNLYIVSQQTLKAKGGLAKYEPQNGMYFGAFVEYESKLTAGDKATFNALTGVNHPIYFTYHHYGAPFPANWAKRVKDVGGAIHLALEATNGLDSVREDAYLIDFAKACAAAQMPIFIRFNSEMNGDWTPWHKSPAKYIETFRTVAKAMKDYAPNVAMVWSPNSVPIQNILAYYPGDDYVDWVGVNLYSVSVFNGDVKQPADHVNPLDLLDYVYGKFAGRKPIQVSEYAATHYSAAEKKDKTAFAMIKMRLLYHGVKFKYPRVKSIHWYSANNLVKAHSPERRLNNFSLLENDKLLKAYGRVLQQAYFLKSVVNGPFAQAEVLENRQVVQPFDSKTLKAIKAQGMGLGTSSAIQLEAYVKTSDPYMSKVVYKLDGKQVGTATEMPYPLALKTGLLTRGKHVIEMVAFDAGGREVARKQIPFTVD